MWIMLKPIRVAQSLPDENGDFVTYYVLYSEERDRYMLDIHYTGEMDSDFVKALMISFVDDCNSVNQDMFKMVDIGSKKELH